MDIPTTITKTTVIEIKPIQDSIDNLKAHLEELKLVSDEEKIKQWNEMFIKDIEYQIINQESELNELVN